jgi:hypothetical protein
LQITIPENVPIWAVLLVCLVVAVVLAVQNIGVLLSVKALLGASHSRSAMKGQGRGDLRHPSHRSE